MKYQIALFLVLLCSIKSYSQEWSEQYLYDGGSVSCFVGNQYDYSLDNYLTINIGSYANAYIKLVDFRTNEDVRQVYISAKTKHIIRNIPQGKYYLKIGFGKNPQSDEYCNFKFNKKPYYYKGDNILDFNLVETIDGFSVPSYELSLDVEVSFTSGTGFSKDVITENAFNN